MQAEGNNEPGVIVGECIVIMSIVMIKKCLAIGSSYYYVIYTGSLFAFLISSGSFQMPRYIVYIQSEVGCSNNLP